MHLIYPRLDLNQSSIRLEIVTGVTNMKSERGPMKYKLEIPDINHRMYFPQNSRKQIFVC